MKKSVAVVLIGRNEGARLERALAAVMGQAERIVYVDSGSTDGSVALAHAAGVEVITLDPGTPFTAARARNAGFDALRTAGLPKYVQFIDGDCALQPGWIAAGCAALDAAHDLGLVTGWRSEIAPEASIYNALCDFEWRRPAGDILACGGDMMVRSAAFADVGGFDPRVIAAEDDDLCVRLRKAGWRLHRLPRPMTRHDAAMGRFGQWWQRSVRSGHGFAQVGALHPGYFHRERLRVWGYGALLPLASFWAMVIFGALGAGALLIYPLSLLRTARGLRQAGLGRRMALHQAFYLTLVKFPNLWGMILYHWQNLRGRSSRIIEYK